jgi:hypothetical protein
VTRSPEETSASIKKKNTNSNIFSNTLPNSNGSGSQGNLTTTTNIINNNNTILNGSLKFQAPQKTSSPPPAPPPSTVNSSQQLLNKQSSEMNANQSSVSLKNNTSNNNNINSNSVSSPPPPPPPPVTKPNEHFNAKVLYSYIPVNNDELPIQENDIVQVLRLVKFNFFVMSLCCCCCCDIWNSKNSYCQNKLIQGRRWMVWRSP